MNTAQPIRKRHSCRQSWQGNIESVFPLLCPVKEADWIPGWEPSLVISTSGLMEKNCIFVEPEGDNEAIWVVTGYEKNSFLDMYRVLPGVSVSQFTIQLTDEGDNSTHADVSYEHTALSEAGEKLVSEFTEISFLEFMSHFQKAINHYLNTGTKLED